MGISRVRRATMTNRRGIPGTGERGAEASPALPRTAYEALRGLAAAYLHRDRRNHTLEPTALVHEAYLKLAAADGGGAWRSRTHFQAVAATAMRQILVDHARRRATEKHGGDRARITLCAEVASADAAELDVLALDEALRDLAVIAPRKARVVELRFFGGLTCAEAAADLGIASKTAEADWYFARAWLRRRLSEREP